MNNLATSTEGPSFSATLGLILPEKRLHEKRLQSRLMVFILFQPANNNNTNHPSTPSNPLTITGTPPPWMAYSPAVCPAYVHIRKRFLINQLPTPHLSTVFRFRATQGSCLGRHPAANMHGKASCCQGAAIVVELSLQLTLLSSLRQMCQCSSKIIKESYKV